MIFRRPASASAGVAVQVHQRVHQPLVLARTDGEHERFVATLRRERQLGLPAFHLLFQFMIFAALLESGTGAVHAINERLAGAWRARRGTDLGRRGRALVAAVLLIGCMFVADRVGLVALIASGYRALALIFLVVYVVPLLTLGLARLLRAPATSEGATPR